MFLLAVIVIGGYVVYAMSPEERARVVEAARRVLESGWDLYHRRANRPDPFREALAARTPVPFLTPTLVAINLAVFALMLVGHGRLSEADTLVRWGGNAGPATTNGEWWRVLTSTFVHAGVLQLVVEMVALAQAALLIELMLGHLALAAAFTASAVFAAIVGLWVDPLSVTVGTAGPILGLQGLVVALIIRGTLRRSTMTIPMPAIASLAPAASIFALYAWTAHGAQWSAGLAAFVIQFGIGLALAGGLAERKPPAVRVAVPAAAMLAIALVIALPLTGTTDVRSEIARLISVEERTTVSYQTATERFKRGTIHRDALAKVIEVVIVPELEAAEGRLRAIAGVPRKQQALVDDAGNFLRLRRDSWLLRARALHEASADMLREADEVERASLDALRHIRSAV